MTDAQKYSQSQNYNIQFVNLTYDNICLKEQRLLKLIDILKFSNKHNKYRNSNSFIQFRH